jgi:hypothetical protein
VKVLSIIIVGISFCLNIYADDCDIWFQNNNVSSTDSDCLLKCASARVGMGSYDCPSRCANFCNQDFITNTLFSVQTIIYYPGLTKAERALISKYPIQAIKVYINKEKAEDLTLDTFKVNHPNDESDAFRHFTWSCLLTMELGEEMAVKFLDAHEQNDKMQNDAERLMDIANNKIGVSKCRNLDKGKISLEEIKKVGLEKLNNKDLTVIKNRSMPK